MPLKLLAIIYCIWWMMKGKGICREGWLGMASVSSRPCDVVYVWSKNTLQSLSNGPWPLDAGKSAFQVKSAPAWGGLLTLSHGGTVYSVTQEEWKHRAITKPSHPLNPREQAMICKRAGEQFFNVATTCPRWFKPVSNADLDRVYQT